jgi:TonB family protein
MPRDLFGDVQHPTVRVGSRSRYTVFISLAAHAAAVLAIVGATILGPVVLPGLASSRVIYDVEIIPPPPPPPPPVVQKPVQVGGKIRPPTKVRDVAPVYPEIAQRVRVEGTVIVETIIDADGRVQSARVLRSIPLLDAAALAAVTQWTYTPTMLNGTAVPVMMTVTVRFQLQ